MPLVESSTYDNTIAVRDRIYSTNVSEPRKTLLVSLLIVFAVEGAWVGRMTR